MQAPKFVFHNFSIVLSGSHSRALLYEELCSLWQLLLKCRLFGENDLDFFFCSYFSITITDTISKPSNQENK